MEEDVDKLLAVVVVRSDLDLLIEGRNEETLNPRGRRDFST